MDLSTARCICLNDLELDQVIFVLAGLAPITRLTDLRCRTKHDVKTKLKKEMVRIQARTWD